MMAKFSNTVFSIPMTLEGRVGVATEKVLVPVLVLTLGTKSKLELDD